MARYSTFKYGGGATGAKYGTSPTNSNLLWTFIVDWDADGFYTGENEAENMVGFSLARGRDNYIQSDGKGFERYKAGRAVVILDNTSGKYNPFNSSSSLYPYVTPGKNCRILVKNGNTGTNYSLMRGKISDIQPYNQGQRRLVKIDIVDGQQFLKDRTIQIGLRSGSGVFEWTTGKWVDLILERANWPEDEWPRTYDNQEDLNGNESGVSVTENFYRELRYAWGWNRDAYDFVGEMEDAELGTFLHDRNGQARFLSSHFSYDQIIELDESQVLKDISTPQPWEVLRNRIENRVHSFKFASDTAFTLWGITGDANNHLPVAAESSRTFDAEFRYFDFPCYPEGYAISKDFDSSSAGSGTDLTTQSSVQISEIGDGATLIFLNNSATNGYIIDLHITGTALYSPYSTIISDEDTTSQAIYGTRVFRLDSPWTQEHDYALDVAQILLANLKTPEQYPTVKIEQRPDIQFGLDLYVDAIHLTSDTMSINRLYRIGKIEHEWLGENGQAVLTTIKTEPYFALDAPTELDVDYLNTFDSDSEVDCSGSTPGKLEFCLDPDGGSSNFPNSYWYISTGGDPTYIYLFPSLVSTAGADIYTTGLNYVIPIGGGLIYDYRWQDTSTHAANSDVAHIKLTTTESGVIIDQTVPFVVTQVGVSGTWIQKTIDLNQWSGETLTEVRFTKVQAFLASSGINLLIDNVGLGKIIYRSFES